MRNENDTTLFVVYGMRYNPRPAEDGDPTMEMEILGAFKDFSDAAVFRDVHADIDTTLEAVGITTATVHQEVPDLEVLLHVSTDVSYPKTLFVRSIGVPMGTTPYLRDEDDGFFEALAYAEDQDKIIEYGVSWMVKVGMISSVDEAVIVENISPEAQTLIEYTIG